MIGFITMLISTLGATGMGSMLKIVAGIADRMAAAGEAREKREMVRELLNREADVEFQKAVFGSDEGGRYARITRRILGIIGVSTLATIGILCVLWPSVPLLTLATVAGKEGYTSVWLWGAAKIGGTSADTVVILTTGHLALLIVIQFGAIIGFYFTPGGRK